ncbi:MAG: IS200/IS605 family transposase [Flavobacterium sp.]
MSSYKQILYQIVFSTKYRENTIPDEHCMELYKYIWGIIKNRNCKLYQINGTENHIHILSDLHPSISLADYIKEIKAASNLWMKNSGLFPKFTYWQRGYGAFTYTYRDKDLIINYIKNQKEHHKIELYEDEYKRMLIEQKIEYDERYYLD